MSGSEPRYLLLINSLSPGGAERSLVDLLEPMRARGITPMIVCLDHAEVGFSQEVIDEGFDLRVLTSSRLTGRVRELRGIIAETRPALLHTTLFDADLVGRLASIGTGTPVLTTLANTTYDEVRIAGDSNLQPWKVGLVRLIDAVTGRRLNDHFHAVSEAVKASSIRHLGITEDSVTVVHRGRRDDVLGRREAGRSLATRKSLGLSQESEIVLSVGRHEYQKGHLHLVDAFARVARSRPNAVLVIAGRRGNASGDLMGRVTDLGLTDRVMLLGHRGDVADLMAAADVFVFPSLWEGLGGVLIEALALEVPIITSDLTATREVVGEDGRSGLLVPAGHDDVLAKEIEELLASPELRAQATSQSRERFENLFLAEDRAGDLLDLMGRVAR